MQSIINYLSNLATDWNPLFWLIINGLIFLPLAFLLPGKKTQPPLHKGMLTDCIYFLLSPILYDHVFRLLILFFSSIGLFHLIQLHGSLSKQPLLLQVFLILVITDFLQYWIHRAFHHPLIWKWHAIHHSAIHVDWLTAARFHPLNFIFYSTAINVLVMQLGFSFKAFMILLPFNAIYSSLVHANLDWTYGPFKYVLASPVFHRWHHTHPNEGGNKNFAPNFPFFDLLFGTFYMPKGKKPEQFGAPYDAISGNLFQQLFYPLRKGTSRNL